MMHRALLLVVWLGCTLCTYAQPKHFHFQEVPLTDALAQIDQAFSDYKIHFIYNDLEDYTVTADIQGSALIPILRQAIGFYPLRILRDKKHIFIESRQKESRKLRGRLVDENRQAVSFATILLYQPSDSVLVTGGVSNENGDFVIPVDAQDVMMRVTRMGYSPMQRLTPVTQMGDVVMVSNPFLLQEMTVSGNRPQYFLHDDGLTLHVQGTSLSRLNSLTDLLDYLPGLRRTDEGYTSVNGAPLIFINGRQVTNLSELSQLRASEIARIQLDENGGPQYSSRSSTVVNIYTVVPDKKGINGSMHAQTSIGKRAISQGQGTLGWVSEHWNLQAGLSYENGQHYQETDILAMDYKNYSLDQRNIIYSPRMESAEGFASADYQINSQHVLGGRYKVSGVLRSLIYHQEYGKPGDFSYNNSMANTDLWKLNYKPRHDASLYYRGKVGKADISLNLAYYQDKMSIQSIRNSGDIAVLGQRNISGNRLWAEKLQVSLPFWKGTLQAGNEATHTQHTDWYQLEMDLDYANKTRRTETQQSLFLLYSRDHKHWKWSAGARYENTRSQLRSQNENDWWGGNHNGVYPYASLTRLLSKGSLGLTLASHSQRPAYNQLNNYSLYNNYMQYISGNPYLKSAVYYQLGAHGQYRWLYARLDYQWVNRFIATSLGSYSSHFMLHYDNIPHARLYSATLALTPKTGRLQWNWSFSLAGQQVSQTYNMGTSRTFNRPLFYLSLHNQYSFSPSWQAWAEWQYHNTGHVGTTLQRHNSSVNVGLAHQRGQWTFRLQGIDLAASSKSFQIWYGNQMEFQRLSYNDTRRVELSISYNFRPSSSRHQESNAGEKEKERFKQY